MKPASFALLLVALMSLVGCVAKPDKEADPVLIYRISDLIAVLGPQKITAGECTGFRVDHLGADPEFGRGTFADFDENGESAFSFNIYNENLAADVGYFFRDADCLQPLGTLYGQEQLHFRNPDQLSQRFYFKSNAALGKVRLGLINMDLTLDQSKVPLASLHLNLQQGGGFRGRNSFVSGSCNPNTPEILEATFVLKNEGNRSAINIDFSRGLPLPYSKGAAILSATDCGATLAPGAQCTVTLQFPFPLGETSRGGLWGFYYFNGVRDEIVPLELELNRQKCIPL